MAGAVCRYVHPGTPAHAGLHQKCMRSRREGAAAWLLHALPTWSPAPTCSLLLPAPRLPCRLHMHVLRARPRLAHPVHALLWLCSVALCTSPVALAATTCILCVCQSPCQSVVPCSTSARGGELHSASHRALQCLAALRLELFRTLLLQKIEFFDRHSTSDLTSLLSVELDTLRNFVFSNVSRDRGPRAVLECVGAGGASQAALCLLPGGKCQFMHLQHCGAVGPQGSPVPLT